MAVNGVPPGLPGAVSAPSAAGVELGFAPGMRSGMFGAAGVSGNGVGGSGGGGGLAPTVGVKRPPGGSGNGGVDHGIGGILGGGGGGGSDGGGGGGGVGGGGVDPDASTDVDGDDDLDVETKKAMRAERNRQSAAASRERKKHHIRELERRVAMLSAENAQLQVEQLKAFRARIGAQRALAEENNQLKRNLVEKSMDVHQLTRRLGLTSVNEHAAANLRRPSTWSSGQFAEINAHR